MRTIVALGLGLSLFAIGIPSQALHAHTVTTLYAAGGTVHAIGLPETPQTPGGQFILGVTTCGPTSLDFEDLGLGCLGGAVVPSGHWIPGYGEDLQPWGQGYVMAVGIATDLVTGPNVGLALCLPSQPDGSTCNNFNDRYVTGCAASIVTDTRDYVDQPDDAVDPGFKAIYAVVFIEALFLDLTTSTLCFATHGGISVTFTN